MNPWLIVFVLCVVVYTIVALVCDVRAFRLPNWLTVSAFVAALVFHAIIGAVENGASGGFSHLWFSLKGFLFGFTILFVPWLLGWGGGGDVKYMGALGAWLGWEPTAIVFILAAILVSVLMIGSFTAYLFTHGFSKTQRRMFPKNKPTTNEERSKRRLSPFALSGGIATWCVLALAVGYPLKKITLKWQPQHAQAEPTHSDEHSAQVEVSRTQKG